MKGRAYAVIVLLVLFALIGYRLVEKRQASRAAAAQRAARLAAPLALALGRGSEVQAPMATAVVGGLATSTFLTLFVVPAVYTVFDDIGARLRGKSSAE